MPPAELLLPGWGKDNADDNQAATRILFDEMDADGSGVLERDEVKAVAEKLFSSDSSREVTEDELDHMMSEMDKDGNGTVDYAEFAKWWTGLGWEVMKAQADEDGVEISELDEADLEDQKHEVTVMLSGIMRDSPTQPTVLYAFDVKVFGVTVYKFFDRYSRLRTVHDDMQKNGCLAGFSVVFPPKRMFASVGASEDAQTRRGHELLHYYAALFTDANVMHHEKTKEFLGFCADDIDAARAKLKEGGSGMELRMKLAKANAEIKRLKAESL